MKNLELGKTLAELYRVFGLLNKHFYNSELETPVFSIPYENKQRVNSMTKKIKQNNGYYFYEMIIPIKAENINGFLTLEILEDILHEMSHLYNKQHDIDDTTNNSRYHSKKFKNTAIERGLSIKNEKHDITYGWGATCLNEISKEFLISIGFGETIGETPDKSKIIRKAIKENKPSSSFSSDYAVVQPITSKYDGEKPVMFYAPVTEPYPISAPHELLREILLSYDPIPAGPPEPTAQPTAEPITQPPTGEPSGEILVSYDLIAEPPEPTAQPTAEPITQPPTEPITQPLGKILVLYKPTTALTNDSVAIVKQRLKSYFIKLGGNISTQTTKTS